MTAQLDRTAAAPLQQPVNRDQSKASAQNGIVFHLDSSSSTLFS
jgi:hypothetical protein